MKSVKHIIILENLYLYNSIFIIIINYDPKYFHENQAHMNQTCVSIVQTVEHKGAFIWLSEPVKIFILLLLMFESGHRTCATRDHERKVPMTLIVLPFCLIFRRELCGRSHWLIPVWNCLDFSRIKCVWFVLSCVVVWVLRLHENYKYYNR